MSTDRRQTRTGGRGASLNIIPGDYALSVGMPTESVTPDGWRWIKLTDVARMESGHTPSRKHPEYWDGDIPWIGIKDAKAHHGRTIHDTLGHTNSLGIDNSSARVLPAGTVCLSRTASVGYVIVTGREMATSQDFVNWICGEQLDPHFLQYLLIAEKRALLRFGTGAVHKTIYYPEVKAFHICLPPLAEQKRIVAILDEAFEAIERADKMLLQSTLDARQLHAATVAAAIEQQDSSWQTTTVATVANTNLGKMLDKSKNRGTPRPYLRNLNVRWFGFDLDDLIEMRFEDTEAEKYTAQRGDLLICEGGYPGRAAVWDEDKPIHFQKAIHRVRFHNPVYNRWLMHYLYYLDCSDQLSRYFTGAGIQHFTGRSLKAMPVALPPSDACEPLCDQFDDIRAAANSLIALASQRRDLLDNFKSSLLRDLFTGGAAQAVAIRHDLGVLT